MCSPRNAPHSCWPSSRPSAEYGFRHRPTRPVESLSVACPSGQRSTPRKRVWGQLHRGFESHRYRFTKGPDRTGRGPSTCPRAARVNARAAGGRWRDVRGSRKRHRARGRVAFGGCVRGAGGGAAPGETGRAPVGTPTTGAASGGSCGARSHSGESRFPAPGIPARSRGTPPSCATARGRAPVQSPHSRGPSSRGVNAALTRWAVRWISCAAAGGRPGRATAAPRQGGRPVRWLRRRRSACISCSSS